MSEEESGRLICPYCSKVVYSDETGWNECEHYISQQDDYVDWSDELSPLGEVSSIIDNYLDEESCEEMNLLLKDLKIGKSLTIDTSWDFFSMEEVIEDLTNEVFIISHSWDSDRPGGSGTFRYLFIGDRKKIRWIIKEFNILLDRLLEYDKNHNKLF